MNEIAMHSNQVAQAAGPLREVGEERCQAGAKRHGADSREFWFYFALTFPAFLLVAVIARLTRLVWSSSARRRGNERSVFGEAKATANRVLPFVFMT